MEINPQTVNPESPNSSNEHNFTYTLTWTPDQYRRGNIQIVTCNNDTLNSGWTTSGSTSISFPGNGRHHYYFQEERWFYHNYWGWGWYWDMLPGRLLQVFIDDINQNQPQNVLGSYNGLPNDFELRDNGSICPNNFASLSIGNVNWNDCNVPCFYDADVTELNIIQGSEYVELIDIPTETILGSFVQLSDYAGINNIGLQRKDDAPGVQTIQTIRVEANKNDVKDTLEIEYFPDTFILNAEVYPETLTTGETAYIDISYYNECGPLPPETKINLEIINGLEFGNLIDPYTNEKVKTITNLDHWWGYAWVEYIADGKPKDGTDTITIRISTTDLDIIPKEINVYIKPPPIYVYTNPEIVGATDTAEVVIKRRNPDGSLEDFPQGQTFELAVLDGCVNGNILIGDSLGVYFSDAQQPIYFVAADSVEGDSGVVRLRVGSDLGGSSMKPLTQGDEKKEKFTDEQTKIAEQKASYKKMIEEKKAVVIESKSGLKGEPPIEAPILEVCYFGSYLCETGYWEGDVVVANECGAGAPVCSTEVQAPLGFKEEVVEWTGTYIFNKEGYYPEPLEISSGGLTYFLRDGEFNLIPITAPSNDKIYAIPLSESFYDPYEIETCFNKNLNNGKGAYQYSFKSIGETDNFIHKPIIIQIYDYSNDPYEMKSESDLATISFEKTCEAIIDFEYQRYRASLEADNFFDKYNVLYGLVDAYWEHEKYHKRDAMRFLNNNYDKKKLKIPKPDGMSVSKTLKGHFSTTFACDEYIKSFNEAKIKGEDYIKSALKEYQKFFEEKWLMGDVYIYEYNKWYNETELYTHWSDSVQKKISRYQSLLAARPGYNPTQCEVELKEIRKLWEPFKKYRNSL